MTWQERLVKEAQAIVIHGQGRLSLNIGPAGPDQTNILIEAGKTHRYLIDKIAED